MMRLTEHGNNAALSMRAKDSDTMRALGFREQSDHWYLCRPVSDDGQVTLNVSVAKTDADWRIDVLDEWFCQPYDYQWMLERDPKDRYARAVNASVERELRVLADAGVLEHWTEGMYV